MISDLCNRCLVIIDANSSVRAIKMEGDIRSIDNYRYPTNPTTLANWVERNGQRGYDQFEIDDRGDAFIPVSTWNGDPVCGYHLIECRDRERNQPYAPRRY